VKIAILSSASAGGAGIAAFRLYKALLEQADIIVDFIDIDIMGQLESRVSPTVSASNEKFTNTHFTIDYASEVRQWVIDILSEYDILNVHWASYLISLAELHELAEKGLRILFTAHDFYHITGGCHYPAGCTGLYQSCNACPQLNHSKFSQETVSFSLHLKRKIFSYPNIYFSAPSNFIVNHAVSSKTVPPNRSYVLRNVYEPLLNNSYHDEEKISLLLIADSFDEKRKGLRLAIDSLNALSKKIKSLDFKIYVHLVGRLDESVKGQLDKAALEVVSHGHIVKHENLVKIFSECHYILSCSYEDNWPNILVEAGSYGCVPIVGKWHGCEEFIDLFGVGWVSEGYNSDAFSDAILRAVSEHENFNLASTRLSKEVRLFHSGQKIRKEFLELFRKILNSSDKHDYEYCATRRDVYSSNYLIKREDIADSRILNFREIPSPFKSSITQSNCSLTNNGKIMADTTPKAMNSYHYGFSQFETYIKNEN
jgi:glycosyltransferase involved in cell wall biosynthesis